MVIPVLVLVLRWFSGKACLIWGSILCCLLLQHPLCEAPRDVPSWTHLVCVWCPSRSLQCITLLAGKQVIHPNQIAVVQEQFTPTLEKIQWAEELITAFKEHQQLGKVNVLSMPQWCWGLKYYGQGWEKVIAFECLRKTHCIWQKKWEMWNGNKIYYRENPWR